VLHVDDTFLIENDISTLEGVKTKFGKFFYFEGKEDAMYVLGIRVYTKRSNRTSSSTCLDEMLKQFNMRESKKELYFSSWHITE
jgi:hypothetical protein